MSEDKQCEALAKRILDGFPNGVIRDVVEKARGMDDISTQEQYESVFCSGLFEGARLAYQTMAPASKEIDAAMQRVVEDCDAALQLTDDTDAQLAIANIRRPVALFMQEQNRHMREAMTRHLADQSGIPERYLAGSKPTDSYSDDEMLPLGLHISMNQPRIFAAFALWADDSDMECRCMHHLMQRFEAEQPTPDHVKREIERKYGHPNQTLAAFARFCINSARRVLALGDEEHFDVSAMSPTEAGKMADDVLSKYTGKGHE